MKRFFSLFVALLATCGSAVHAQTSGQTDGVNEFEYIGALSELDRIDKSGNLNQLMEKVIQPRSSSELKAYADWLKARVMNTDTREPLYYWGYSHLLRMSGINDTSALLFVTAVLMLQSESARCADASATSGKQHIALLMRSGLRVNYWAQSPEVRRQARQFALREEERKRMGPATSWVCAGGMEEMIAAMEASAQGPSGKGAAVGSTSVNAVSAVGPRFLSDAAFDEQRKRIRAEFDQYFSNERNVQTSDR